MEKEITDTIMLDKRNQEMQRQRSLVNDLNPPSLESVHDPRTPNAVFESSGSTNYFAGIPLTPGIVTERFTDDFGRHSPFKGRRWSGMNEPSSCSTILHVENDGDGNSEKQNKGKRVQILSLRDIAIISIATVMLSILVTIILILLTKTCGLISLNEEGNVWKLVVVAVTFIFAFIIITLCIKIQSNFKAMHEEYHSNSRIPDDRESVNVSVIQHNPLHRGGACSVMTPIGSGRERDSRHNRKSHRSASTPTSGSGHSSHSGHHRVRTWSKGDQLGQGSFGKVYMALDHHSKQMFVVKQVALITDYLGNNLFSEVIKATQNEVRTLSKLSHPNIVRYLGSSSTKNHLNIFLEYMSGGSIRGMLEQFGPFELTLIKSYTLQILRGLSFLHSQHIIHRDIKGSNILVNPDGCLKLADFGVAKLLSFDTQLPSSLHGTVHWMAPEVINQNRYDYKADIYSLGITILEMINGEPPNYTKEALAVMFMAKDSDIGKGLNIQIPESLGKYGTPLVAQCLQRNPNSRPTAKELLMKHPFLYEMDDIDFEDETDRHDVHLDDDRDDDGDGDVHIAVDGEQNEDQRHSRRKEEDERGRVRLRCINDVKQAVKERVEISNKIRNQLIDRKKIRDLKRKQTQNEREKREDIHPRESANGNVRGGVENVTETQAVRTSETAQK